MQMEASAKISAEVLNNASVNFFVVEFHPDVTPSDADSIVVGNYITDGSRLIAEGRIVDVPHMRMSAPVTAMTAICVQTPLTFRHMFAR